ncbi:DUF695 domain-containing protein [Mucilaginibacter sp.]|uniref:DUF695 domain-containing protein n=1 Tax=Mucilaginibacter sp. TaxID=1882438 RepID=UPI002841A868|nr:DUF695 domain-containing protein [Mucilaginibacter sp.]MDR3693690.1 DUF695 domain-containing protein [Mucilaginibacter sp.]
MNIFKDIFKSKNEPIQTYQQFWDWFKKNERNFYIVVKVKGDIKHMFFDKLAPKLNELKCGIYFLTGMCDRETAELILTPDGVIKNIFFAEELVKAAPKIDGWKFTALKPASDTSIEMAGFKFNTENISFYSNDHTDAPDQIDLSIVHNDLTENNRAAITNGVFIFLDNYLGELNVVTLIDRINIISKKDAKKELVPIARLEAFLKWREKEFLEKYEDAWNNTDNDNYAVLKAQLENGNVVIATINTALLNWESKASHPWIMNVEIKYDGSNNNGMPDNATSELLIAIEDEMLDYLKCTDGYLNIGHQTAENVREIYFACKDFRKPSDVLYQIKQKYKPQINLDYNIYKDKYWQSFNRFKS